jgi:hypothetical protein
MPIANKHANMCFIAVFTTSSSLNSLLPKNNDAQELTVYDLSMPNRLEITRNAGISVKIQKVISKVITGEVLDTYANYSACLFCDVDDVRAPVCLADSPFGGELPTRHHIAKQP